MNVIQTDVSTALYILRCQGTADDWRSLFVLIKDIPSGRRILHAYRLSRAWQIIRERRLVADGHCCTVCGARSDLEIHHLTYDRIGAEQLDDLMTLCHYHHNQSYQPTGTDVVARFLEILLKEQPQGWQEVCKQKLFGNDQILPV